MTYHIREDTTYNRTTKKDEVVAWLVSWNLRYNFPDHANGGGTIAGQERKRFTEKEKMDNYVIGRITAHAQYFQELSPPVPEKLAWKFSRNGQLLPGYTVEEKKPPVPVLEVAAPAEDAPAKAEKAAPDDNSIDYSKYIRKRPQRDSVKNEARQSR